MEIKIIEGSSIKDLKKQANAETCNMGYTKVLFAKIDTHIIEYPRKKVTTYTLILILE